MSATTALRELALSDTGFVFDPTSGATFTVNASGLCVLRAMKEGLSRPAVAAQLRERFEMRGGDVERDIDDFAALLRQHGLLRAEDET